MAKPDKEQEDNQSLAERIALDINIGVLRHGEWLKQSDLERRYGSNRFSLRRALDELATKRIVEYRPNRGYQVFEPDPEQRAEIREVRTLLECHAAPSMAENVTEEDLVDLQKLAERFQEAIYNGTVLEQNEANVAFHMALLELCSNKALAELIKEYRKRGLAALVSRWQTFAQLEKANKDHFLMIEALRNRDASRLRLIIEAHINQHEVSEQSS